MPRFVLLDHQLPEDSTRLSHWDLMFESNDVLLTWALPTIPEIGQSMLVVEKLPDHRLEYLHYEGAISENRGSVQQVAQGTYTVIEKTDTEFVFQVKAENFSGIIHLQAIDDEAQRWNLIFKSA